MIHSIYALRDSERIFYIGCTGSLDERLRHHRREPYWGRVERVEILDMVSGRKNALKAEAEAIRRHRPDMNVTHARKSDPWLVDAYLAGASQAELAEVRGVSPQAISARLATVAPGWLLKMEKDRRKARSRMRKAAKAHRAAILRSRACRGCGAAVLGGSICAEPCKELEYALQNHLNGRGDKLVGRGRWFIEGSAAHEAAKQCYETGHPLFERLDEDLRRQIRGEARSWEELKESRPHRPCELCGSNTTNPHFCSLECYRSSDRFCQPTAASA